MDLHSLSLKVMENVQGVLSFLRFKDGKIFRQETGASNLLKG